MEGTASQAILKEAVVRTTRQQAWKDSLPEIKGGHEEGGFILKDAAGNLSVLRWPMGQQDAITVPSHPQCIIGTSDIVATFHTHPNTGDDYLQEPSETDIRAVRDDPDLKGEDYAGEFVISETNIYLITPAGQVHVMGGAQQFFDKP